MSWNCAVSTVKNTSPSDGSGCSIGKMAAFWTSFGKEYQCNPQTGTRRRFVLAVPSTTDTAASRTVASIRAVARATWAEAGAYCKLQPRSSGLYSPKCFMALAGPPRSHENGLPPSLFSHQCVEEEFSEVRLTRPLRA